MKDIILGLPEEAKAFLNEHALEPGELCWCCGLPLADDWTPPIDGKIAGFNGEYPLYRHILRKPGMVAREILQAAITVPELGFSKYYVSLKIQSANGPAREIRWKTDDWLNFNLPK